MELFTRNVNITEWRKIPHDWRSHTLYGALGTVVVSKWTLYLEEGQGGNLFDGSFVWPTIIIITKEWSVDRPQLHITLHNIVDVSDSSGSHMSVTRNVRLAEERDREKMPAATWRGNECPRPNEYNAGKVNHVIAPNHPTF